MLIVLSGRCRDDDNGCTGTVDDDDDDGDMWLSRGAGNGKAWQGVVQHA